VYYSAYDGGYEADDGEPGSVLADEGKEGPGGMRDEL
jgi:hypothetical protein